MTLKEVRAMLARQCEKAGSQAEWAAANGLSAGNVSDVLNGRREPGDVMLTALGLERNEVTYRRVR